MQDILLAERRLKEKESLTLVIAKDGRVLFETESHGIMTFVQTIEKLDKQLYGSAVADKIIGHAAALLCGYSKVASVFAVMISEEGIRVLEENGIPYQFETRVPNILNREKTDVCPFEKLTASSRTPEEAYKALKSFKTLRLDSEC